MKIINCFLLLAFFCPKNIFAQKMYELAWKKELIVTGTGAFTLGLGIYLGDEVTLFTPDELLTLDHYGINAFDRIATGFSSINSHEVSNYFFYGSLGLPLTFLASKKTRSEYGSIFTLWGEAMLLNGGVTVLCKHAFQRPRPFVFDDDVIMGRKLTVNAKSSFISGHTSLVSANSFFTARVFSDYFPDSKLRPYVWAVAATLPAVTGYLRVRAGRHYPTDTIAGYLVGALVGWGIPTLHRSQKDSAQRLHVKGSASGIQINYFF